MAVIGIFIGFVGIGIGSCANRNAFEKVAPTPKIGHLYYEGYNGNPWRYPTNNPFATADDRIPYGHINIAMPTGTSNGWVQYNKWSVGVFDGTENAVVIYAKASAPIQQFNLIFKPIEP